MSLPEENVHPLTLAWWQGLPWCYRNEDAQQGYDVGPPWHGLNRDPRFVTGWDGWSRTNTSTKPWEASIALTRRFAVEPGAPVIVRSWHTPAPLEDLTDTTSELGQAALGLMALGETTTTVRVKHTLRNHTGTVVSEKVQALTGDPSQSVDTWWTPDRFGVMHATVEITVNVPGFMDALQAIHVGTQDAPYEDLPNAEDFRIARPYPLLRFMDGVGFQAGIVSDTVEQMHNGGWTDPATAPDIALPYLSAILGLPTDYADTLTTPRLREHLVGLVDGGTPSAGTTAAIAAVAKQWLTGAKQVSVIPGITPGAYPSAAERDLLSATGQPGAVYYQPDAPTPPRPDIYWEGTPGASTSVWTVDAERRYENLRPNGSFEHPVTVWGSLAASITRDETVAHHGAASLKVTPTAETSATFSDFTAPVDGSEVTITAKVYTPVARTLLFYVQPEDGNIQAPTRVEATPGVWSDLRYKYTPEAGKRYRIWVLARSSTQPWWVDSVTEARTQYNPGGYFDGDTTEPTPTIVRDVWLNTDGTPHTFDTNTWTWTPHPEHQGLGDAVLETWDAHQFLTAHTLILLVKPDEVPDGDVPAFQEFLNTSGVTPAGHQVIARPATPTWEQWQAYVGDTWQTMHTRAPRWVDHHSAGINLQGE